MNILETSIYLSKSLAHVAIKVADFFLNLSHFESKIGEFELSLRFDVGQQTSALRDGFVLIDVLILFDWTYELIEIG